MGCGLVFGLSSARRLLAIGGYCVSVPLVSNPGKPLKEQPAAKRQISRREWIGIAILVVAVMAFFPVIRWLSGGSELNPTHLPEISPRELAASHDKWRQKGPKDYNLRMEVVSSLHKTDIRLEVRGGEGKRLVRNDIESTRPEEMSQWTIDGQMEQMAAYIKRDTSIAARNAGMRMVNVGKFDPNLGYPLEYSRQGTGDQTQFHMTVLDFQPVSP